MIKFAPKTTKTWLRTLWFAVVRACRSVVLLEDTAERIARGSAIGLFFTFQLFVGSQIVFAMIFCKLFRANVLASVPWTFISNPFTGVPIYYTSYRLGCLVWPQEKQLTWQKFQDLIGDGFSWQTVKDGLKILAEIGIPLQIGSTIISTVVALLGYVVIRRAVVYAQHRRHMRRKRWHESVKAAAQSVAERVHPKPTHHGPTS